MKDAPHRRIHTTATTLRLARGATIQVCLGLLSVFAREIARAIPGPEIVTATSFALLVGMIMAVVHVAFSIPIKATLDRPDAPLNAGQDRFESWFGAFVSFLGALLIWFALDVTGTLLVLPAIAIVVGFGAALGLRRIPSGERLDSPKLERRLARFAREVGLGEVEVRVDERGSIRSTRTFAPDVRVYGRTIEVPRDLIDAGYDVVETRLAVALVRLRRTRTLDDTGRMSIIFAVLLTGAVITSEGALIRASGAVGIDDPTFLPAAAFVIAVTIGVMRRIVSVWMRRSALRHVRSALDMTRNPEGILRSLEYDLERGAADEEVGLLHLLTGRRPTGAQVRAKVDEWLASRRVCLLFTDIVGSTDALERVGDERWYEILSEHDHAIRRRAHEFGGEELHKAGDGFLLVFPQAGQAALAASEMQRDLRALRLEGSFPAEVRMGMHSGEVIRRGSELVGREVHIAARIGAAASGDEILVSETVREELASAIRFRFGEPRSVEMKGFSEPHPVVPLLWTDEHDPNA